MHHFKWKNGVVNERDSQIILVVSNDFWWMIWDDFWFLLNLDEFLTWFTSLCMFFWFDDVFKWMTLTHQVWLEKITSQHRCISWNLVASLDPGNDTQRTLSKGGLFPTKSKKKIHLLSCKNSQENSFNSFNSNSTLKFEKNNKGKIPQTKSPFHMDFFVDFGRWTLKPNWPGHCYKKNRDERRAGQASRKTWLGPIVLKNPRLKRSPNQWREIHGFFVGPWGPPVRPGN